MSVISQKKQPKSFTPFKTLQKSTKCALQV